MYNSPPNAIVQVPPLPWDSKQLPVSILRHIVSLKAKRNDIQSVGQLTSTLDGNASLVRRRNLLINVIADVLHSNASMQKWSNTSNVNAVFGFIKLAGKSFARRRSWTYWSKLLAHWHHLIVRVKIPVDATIVRTDLDPICVPVGR